MRMINTMLVSALLAASSLAAADGPAEAEFLARQEILMQVQGEQALQEVRTGVLARLSQSTVPLAVLGDSVMPIALDYGVRAQGELAQVAMREESLHGLLPARNLVARYSEPPVAPLPVGGTALDLGPTRAPRSRVSMRWQSLLPGVMK